MIKNLRIYLGLVIWIVSLFLFNSFLNNTYEELAPNQKIALTEIKEYYFNSPEYVEIYFENWIWIKPGDQVIARDDQGNIVSVGRVMAMGSLEPGYSCKIKFFDKNYQEKLTRKTEFYYVETKTSAVWILNTLVPNEKKKAVLSVVDRFLEHNRGYISDIVLPLIKDLGRETYLAIEEDFPEVWKLHQSRLNNLFEKHKVTTLENELMPMLKNHLWPLVQKESNSTIKTIGLELWSDFPKWGIAWRSVYEKIPGTDDDHVEFRWNKYLQDAAIPILEKRTPELLKVLKNILIKASKDEKISSALKRGLSEILADDEFIFVLKDIFRDLILNNKSLKARLKNKIDDPDFQKKLSFLSSRFEPYVNQIFNLLLLDEDLEGISPNLAKVLRTQILHKDTHFIFAEFKEKGLKPKPDFRFLGIERKDPFIK